jgi:hypothetical protein
MRVKLGISEGFFVAALLRMTTGFLTAQDREKGVRAQFQRVSRWRSFRRRHGHYEYDATIENGAIFIGI